MNAEAIVNKNKIFSLGISLPTNSTAILSYVALILHHLHTINIRCRRLHCTPGRWDFSRFSIICDWLHQNQYSALLTLYVHHTFYYTLCDLQTQTFRNVQGHKNPVELLLLFVLYQDVVYRYLFPFTNNNSNVIGNLINAVCVRTNTGAFSIDIDRHVCRNLHILFAESYRFYVIVKDGIMCVCLYRVWVRFKKTAG